MGNPSVQDADGFGLIGNTAAGTSPRSYSYQGSDCGGTNRKEQPRARVGILSPRRHIVLWDVDPWDPNDPEVVIGPLLHFVWDTGRRITWLNTRQAVIMGPGIDEREEFICLAVRIIAFRVAWIPFPGVRCAAVAPPLVN